MLPASQCQFSKSNSVWFNLQGLICLPSHSAAIVDSPRLIGRESIDWLNYHNRLYLLVRAEDRKPTAWEIGIRTPDYVLYFLPLNGIHLRGLSQLLQIQLFFFPGGTKQTLYHPTWFNVFSCTYLHKLRKKKTQHINIVIRYPSTSTYNILLCRFQGELTSCRSYHYFIAFLLVRHPV